jgi:hypothetical protein
MLEQAQFSIKSPTKTKKNDNEPLVSNKLQLPKIQIKTKKELNITPTSTSAASSQRKVSIDEDDEDTVIPSASGTKDVEEFKKKVDKINVGKTKYDDKNLLSVVKESIA